MPAPQVRPDPWRALVVLCIANYLVVLDTAIVNTAVPNIMATLDIGINQILWVINGYLLALGSLLVVFGRLGDVAGPRRLFVLGLGLFTAASVLCGLAQSPWQLIAARVLQGVGAATLSPQALVLIAAIFPPARLGAAYGIFTAVAGLAGVSGPTLGGLLVTEFGWRSVFFINLPIGLAGALLAVRLVPDRRPGRRHRFDLVGVTLATLALVGLVFGLVEGQRYGWGTIAGPVSIPLIFVVVAVLFAAFVRWDRRAPEPLLPAGLSRDRNFPIATAVMLILSFSVAAFLIVYVLETQTMLGMSPLASGVTLLPWTVALGAVAPVAGRLADRIGGRVLLVTGLALNAVALLGVALVSAAGATPLGFLAPLLVMGLGQGLTMAPTTTEAMRGVGPRHTGAASGLLNTARHVGAALGAAVGGALLESLLAAGLPFFTAARWTLVAVAATILLGCGLSALMVRHRPAALGLAHPPPAGPGTDLAA